MGREATRAEEIPRSSALQPERPVTGTVVTGSKAKDRRGAGRPATATPHAAAPHAAAPEAATLDPELSEVVEDESEADEIQI